MLLCVIVLYMQSYKTIADEFKRKWIAYQRSIRSNEGTSETDNNGTHCNTDTIKLETRPCTLTDDAAHPEYGINALTRDYWRVVETQCTRVKVDYGSDLDISSYRSGFHKAIARDLGDVNTATVASAPLDSLLVNGQFTERFYKESGRY